MGAMPGKIIQCLKKTKTENPLVLIDEVALARVPHVPHLSPASGLGGRAAPAGTTW